MDRDRVRTKLLKNVDPGTCLGKFTVTLGTHCTEFSSKSNPIQTHLICLSMSAGLLENTHTGVLKQVGNKLCKTVSPQEQG